MDDEPFNNELVARALCRREGRRVVVARSGAEALAVLAHVRVDIIVTDYAMPAMNGVQLLERARTIAPEAVPVMVTGCPDEREVVDAQARGLVRHVVAKPWHVHELCVVVDHAVRSAAGDRASD